MKFYAEISFDLGGVRFVVEVIIILKLLHYLAIFVAGGLGVANGVLGSTHKKANAKPAAPVQRSMMTLARLGLAAIILLWITGIMLALKLYGGLGIGWAFHMKLAGATALFGAIAYLNIILVKSAKMQASPHPATIKFIQAVSRGSLLVVLLGIAITTTS